MIQTPKQREYRRNATHRWNVKTGATRSGKTYGDYFLLPKRLRAGSGKEGANVILGNAFGVPGITVDTHFGRLARRFGWTTQTDAVKAEHEIGALGADAGIGDALLIRHLDQPLDHRHMVLPLGV